MKIVVLLSVTAFMATGAVGLKCYDCGNAPIKGTCTTEKDCPTWANACVTTYLGENVKKLREKIFRRLGERPFSML